MSLFHRVVIAVDETSAAADARALAGSLAAPGAELITAHVAAGHHDTAEAPM